MILSFSCPVLCGPWHRVSVAPGNTGNLLEFDIPPGNTGNLLKFNWSSWKIRFTRYVSLFTLFSWCNIKLFMCLEYLHTVTMLYFSFTYCCLRSTVFLVSWLDGTVMSVGRSSSSHAQLEIVHTLLVVVIILIKL